MRTIKYLLCLIVTSILSLTGCNPDFDVPPLDIPQATLQPNTTILELKTLFNNDIDTIGKRDDGSSYIIAGRVIGNDVSGNIYKSLIIQDETAALTMSINATNMYNSYRLGQQIVINCSGMYIGKYRGLQQLGYPDLYNNTTWQTTFMPDEFFQIHAELNGLPDVAKLDSIPLDLSSLPSSGEELLKMQSQLVLLENVYFKDGGKTTFADENSSASRTLVTSSGATIDVRNSNYSNFADEMLPAGYGNVVGILSYYNSSFQLLLRQRGDCYDFGAEKEGTKDNPYSVEKAIENQNKDVKGWVKGYIVGAVAPGVTEIKSNEDIQYSDIALANTLVIAPSASTKDYTKCLVVSLPADTDLRKYANLVDNPGNLGKEILLKGELATYMGTYGIIGNTGSASEFEIENVITEGNGSKEHPYSISQLISFGVGKTEVYVQGYIVGCVEGQSISSGALFTGPFSSESNVLLSDISPATDYKTCVPVQLSYGTDARTKLNLMSNAGNLGKIVTMKCNIETYFGTTGIKNITEFSLEGSVVEPGDPDTGDTTPVTSLFEDFSSFNKNDDAKPEGWSLVSVSGDRSWRVNTFNDEKYAQGTLYNATAGSYEFWMLTAPLDLDNASKKVFSFDSQYDYWNTTSDLEIYILDSNDPATANKTKLDVAYAKDGVVEARQWLSSGDYSLAGYSGIKYIGFRYTGSDVTTSTTYRLDNIRFGTTSDNGGDNGGGDDNGNGGDDNNNGENSKENPYTIAKVQEVTTATEVWVKGIIVGCVDGMNINSGALFTGPFTVASNLLLADDASTTVVDKTVPVQLASGSDARNALNLSNNPDNLGKTVLMKCDVTKYFGVTGIKNITEYEIQ